MQKITRQFMPHVERAPWFMAAVQRAKRGETQGALAITQKLADFESDPFLLYACLWYAYSEDVSVTFLPSH